MTVLNDLDHTCGISDEKLTELFKESIRIDDEIRKITFSSSYFCYKFLPRQLIIERLDKTRI